MLLPQVILAHILFYSSRATATAGLLLLDAYPRVCAITEATKIIFRPDKIEDLNRLPHYLSCGDPFGVQHQADTGMFRYLLPAYQVNVIIEKVQLREGWGGSPCMWLR